MTEHEQGFHRLIAALYEAPLQSERWPEVWPQVAAFLAEICGDGDAGFLECRNLSRPDPTRPDPTRPDRQDAASDDGPVNRFDDPGLMRSAGHDLASRLLCRAYLNRRSAPRLEDREETAADKTELRLWRERIGFLRDPEQSPLPHAHRKRLQCLDEHLRRAVRLHHERVAERGQTRLGSRTIDALGMALFVVNAELRVRNCSSGAEKLLAIHSGLMQRDGWLRFSRVKDQSRLVGLVKRATGPDFLSDGMPVFLSDESGSHQHQVFVLPLPTCSELANESTEQLALVLVSEADQPMDETASHANFRFTPAERSLASALCRGLSLKDYAEAEGLKIATVRSRLQSLFLKTKTGRQGELVALLARYPKLPGHS
jgi:DNA-binding CsgD family transcriptional regulator